MIKKRKNETCNNYRNSICFPERFEMNKNKREELRMKTGSYKSKSDCQRNLEITRIPFSFFIF